MRGGCGTRGRVIFGDTGHLPQLERPVRFNRDLEEFLDGRLA